MNLTVKYCPLILLPLSSPYFKKLKIIVYYISVQATLFSFSQKKVLKFYFEFVLILLKFWQISMSDISQDQA